jgi:GT2 family glycosyltransferase
MKNSLETAILILLFNRPETTIRVFDKISQIKPQRLYIASDGPRKNFDGEKEKVKKVREIATRVDWPCEVKTLFRNENLGCKKGVSSAITWFFEQEEQGIILEDDCVPNLDFFTFCESLLDRYAEDERVSVITGNNFQNNKWRGDASYYFSKYNHCWGWASWRRSWKDYRVYGCKTSRSF